MLLWRGIQGASKNPSGTSQTAVVLEIWPTEISISLANMREGQTKIEIFSILGFQTPLKAQNSPQRGPLPGHLIGPFLSSGFTSGLRPLLVDSVCANTIALFTQPTHCDPVVKNPVIYTARRLFFVCLNLPHSLVFLVPISTKDLRSNCLICQVL